MKLRSALLVIGLLLAAPSSAAAETLTIATVANRDMIRMQSLAGALEKSRPDITLKWVTLEERELRRRVAIDVAIAGGNYDVITIGTYEAPIRGQEGWLESLGDLPESYDVDDLLPAIRNALSVDGELYAAPWTPPETGLALLGSA